MSQVNQARTRAQGPGRGHRESRFLNTPKPWMLSPSDFAFLWDECRRCFYKKVVLRQPRPRTPFPKVFTLIDGAMKEFYLGERAESLAQGAPTGSIGSPDKWVKSEPVALPGYSSPLQIRGRVDALVECDDGTIAVIDFKTAEPSDRHIGTYSRQLHAYALALEHPAAGCPAAVSGLGLLCFSPDEYEAAERRAALLGDVSWIPVPRDDASFHDFLGEVMEVLNNAEPPSASAGCVWCAQGVDGRFAA